MYILYLMFITGRLIFSSVFEIIPRDTNKKNTESYAKEMAIIYQ